MIEAVQGGGAGHRPGLLDALRRAAGSDAAEAPSPGAWTIHGMAPLAVVSPPDADAVAAVLELCSAEGWTVEPAGAGTWLDHGRAPGRAPDIVLSTRRLAGRIDSEPADLVVGADAGVPLARLGQRLAEDGQELALDPPYTGEATIGAAIALAAAGPLRAGYGTARDHVLGLDVVTGDGRRIRFGGRVVKNVAGYDGVRLLTGSRGTLGVITGLWLRLRAQPVEDRTHLARGELPRLLEVIDGLKDVRPAAAELLGPATAAALGLPRAWTLALRLRGGRAELADAVARLGGIMTGLEVTQTAPVLWATLGRAEAAAAPLLRVAGLAADLGAALDRCMELISASGNGLDDWHLAAHARDGIVRLWPAGARAAGMPGAALSALRAAAEAHGGSLLLEGAPPALQAVVAARTASDEATRRLEQGLKRVMDPAGILAPGRWP